MFCPFFTFYVLARQKPHVVTRQRQTLVARRLGQGQVGPETDTVHTKVPPGCQRHSSSPCAQEVSVTLYATIYTKSCVWRLNSCQDARNWSICCQENTRTPCFTQRRNKCKKTFFLLPLRVALIKVSGIWNSLPLMCPFSRLTDRFRFQSNNRQRAVLDKAITFPLF